MAHDCEEQEVEMATTSRLLQHEHLAECVVYYDVPDVLFYQIFLIGNNHRAAKCAQVGVVQLIWDTADFLRTVNLDIPVPLGKISTVRKSIACS